MAAGEYVSVSSQADSEKADLAREKRELAADPAFEHHELAALYVERGVNPALAGQVAEQLMAKGALQAHARDELGLSDTTAARPVQAALASAASFATGAALPLLVVILSPPTTLLYFVGSASLSLLGILGALGARVGGAPILRGTIRVIFWGALAMAITAGVGSLFGTRAAG